MLERLGSDGSGKADTRNRITDRAVSPDGEWVVLRTRGALTFETVQARPVFAGGELKDLAADRPNRKPGVDREER